MSTKINSLAVARRFAAIAVCLVGSTSLMQAQAPAQPSIQLPAFRVQAPLLMASAEAPAAPAAAGYSSSLSGDLNLDSIPEAHLDLSSAQPPPRRRYGRPNYADSHTNPDGSSKWTFDVGGGFVMPVQDTGNYLTTSYGFQVGGGRNFNKHVGVLVQFDYDHFGFQGSVLNNQQNLYNSFCPIAAQAAQQCSPVSGLDGSTHVWSFTIDPIYNFYNGEKTGAYVIGGVGFYHKYANFTIPAIGEYCGIYGCYEYSANQTIDDYTSNAFGLNAGLGLTYKPSRFNNERLFMEARYVFNNNSPRTGYDPVTNPNSSNYYPPNANQTYFIPVTFGLRF